MSMKRTDNKSGELEMRGGEKRETERDREREREREIEREREADRPGAE